MRLVRLFILVVVFVFAGCAGGKSPGGPAIGAAGSGGAPPSGDQGTGGAPWSGTGGAGGTGGLPVAAPDAAVTFDASVGPPDAAADTGGTTEDASVAGAPDGGFAIVDSGTPM